MLLYEDGWMGYLCVLSPPRLRAGIQGCLILPISSQPSVSVPIRREAVINPFILGLSKLLTNTPTSPNMFSSPVGGRM